MSWKLSSGSPYEAFRSWSTHRPISANAVSRRSLLDERGCIFPLHVCLDLCGRIQSRRPARFEFMDEARIAHRLPPERGGARVLSSAEPLDLTQKLIDRQSTRLNSSH